MSFVKLLATAVTLAFQIFHMKSKAYDAKSMYWRDRRQISLLILSKFFKHIKFYCT